MSQKIFHIVLLKILFPVFHQLLHYNVKLKAIPFNKNLSALLFQLIFLINFSPATREKSTNWLIKVSILLTVLS